MSVKVAIRITDRKGDLVEQGRQVAERIRPCLGTKPVTDIPLVEITLSDGPAYYALVKHNACVTEREAAGEISVIHAEQYMDLCADKKVREIDFHDVLPGPPDTENCVIV